jgi:diguanylate cyclase (GGDEF)-like protein
MLDTESLRVAFGVVSVTMMVLFYFVTFRTTRSPYAAWWCAALALFVSGSSLYLLNGTSHQVWANPLGNVLVVGGAGAVWAGARSLWTAGPAWRLVTAAGAVVGLFSVLDNPETNIWAGGPYYLGATALLLGMAAVELGRQDRAYRPGPAAEGATYRLALRAMTIGCAIVGGFFALRLVVYLTVGWRDPLFATAFGGQATTLISTVMLATVSFSMSLLSHEQQTALLRESATRDGLTGLLNRVEFLRLAEDRIADIRRGGGSAQLILADLDHFKQINDEQGHRAGDRAITTFADACRDAVRTTDLVGRYGGEEFILMLVGATPDRATQVTDAIDAAMTSAGQLEAIRLPTVSYGIATLDGRQDLEHTIQYADEALYRAKAAGRNRSVHYFPGVA